MSELIYTLKFDIRSYWRAGSGSEAGAYADLLVIKQNGLPYLPGKQLKGILRKAFTIAKDAEWLTGDLFSRLFGEKGPAGQGILQVTNAQLPEQERQYFTDNNDHCKLLFHTKDTQAVLHDTGTTKQGSLRTMEVTVPMQLEAQISLSEAVSEININDLLKKCCSLITTIGADRNRGLGQVTITVKGETK